MLKNKILAILLGVFSIVLLPSMAFAQTTEEDMLYEDTSIDWDYDWDDWDLDDYNTTDPFEDLNPEEAVGLAALATIFSGLAIVGVIIGLGVGIAMYVYTSLAYMSIAKKLNSPNAWFAWVPILNIVLHFQLAQMSGWYALLMLIPVANIIVYIMALMKICERRGMEKLLALLALIPVANLILLGILAWKKDEAATKK